MPTLDPRSPNGTRQRFQHQAPLKKDGPHKMAAMTGVASPAVALLTGLPSPPRTCTDVTLKMCIPAPVERERMRNRSKVDPPQ